MIYSVRFNLFVSDRKDPYQ